MRSLDQLYWDTHCNGDCGCTSLKEALARHPELRRVRDRSEEDPDAEPPEIALPPEPVS